VDLSWGPPDLEDPRLPITGLLAAQGRAQLTRIVYAPCPDHAVQVPEVRDPFSGRAAHDDHVCSAGVEERSIIVPINVFQ
jgi:hypothetical protein